MSKLLAYGETPLRTAPTSRRLEHARELDMRADGTESNAAVAASALGTPAGWVSVLPDTPMGRRVHSEVEGYNVETMVTWAGQQRQSLAFHEEGVGPRESRVVHDRQATPFESVSPSDLPMEQLLETDILVTGLSTAVLSKQSAETTTAVLRASGNAQTAVVLDYEPALAEPSVYRGILEEIDEHVDIIAGTQEAVHAIADVDDTGRELVSTISVEYDPNIAVVIDHNGNGAAIQNTPGTNVVHEAEGPEMKPVNEAGVPGVLTGAFCHSLLESQNAARALETSLAACGLVRTLEGPLLTTTQSELQSIRESMSEGRR